METAAFVTTLPLELGPNLPFEIEGRQGTLGVPLWRAVTPDYFRATRIPLRRGRNFTQSNTAQSHSVVIINEILARQYFSDQSPIGERLTIGGGMGPDFADRSRDIVGVVENVREEGLEDPPPAMLFIPASQVPDTITRLFNKYMPTSWVIRTKVKPMSLSARVRNEVLAVDAAMPVSDLHPIQEVLTDSIARQRFNMLLLGNFAAVAPLLAAVGIYGVISYSVGQRSHEIGIRMALGARREEVLKLVVGRGLKLTLIGVAIGIAGALALTRLLSSLLYGVKPTDPPTFIAVSLILTALALAACYIPARRAMKVDPMVALRYE